MKVAVIGLGKMGLSHASIVGAHPLVSEFHVCDMNKMIRNGFEKYSSSVFFHEDYEKMIKSVKLDGAVIATPTKLHYKMVKRCLDNGVSVFCEKPFCMDLEEGADLVQLAKENRLNNQTGYHNNFLGTFSEMRRLLKSGILGDIFHFSGESYGPVVVRKKGKTWRTTASEGGGCLSDYATHVLNLIQITIGDIEVVKGTLLKKYYSQDVEDAVYSNLVLKNGASGSVSVNWSDETYRKMSTSITVWGAKGKIVCDATELKVFLKEEDNSEKLEKGRTIKYVTDLTAPVWFNLRGEEYSSQMDYFVRNVSEGKIGEINTFEQALKTDIVLDMLRKDGGK